MKHSVVVQQEESRNNQQEIVSGGMKTGITHIRNACRHFHKKGWSIGVAALGFTTSFLTSGAQAQTEVMLAVDQTTQFLISNWRGDEDLKKVQPPQVLPLAAGSRVYGACSEQISGVELGGSAYCETTHTIYLVPEELQAFYQAFGPSAVGYVVAHEFGHAIQNAYNVKLQGPARELQADCLAGMIFRNGSKELGLTRDSVIAMATAAYSIGSDSHGSGAQRSYALLSGMGVLKSSCESSAMKDLADGRNRDSDYLELSQQRSGATGPNTSETPYPKSLKSALQL